MRISFQQRGGERECRPCIRRSPCGLRCLGALIVAIWVDGLMAVCWGPGPRLVWGMHGSKTLEI